MEKKKILFWQWLLERWKTGVLFLGISGIYFLICWLYGLEPVGAFYAFMLTLVLLAAVLHWNYQQFKKKHEQLTRLLAQEYLAQEHFPETKNLLERDYQELLLHLSTCISSMESEREKVQTEMNQYYTMWAHQIKTPISGLRLLLQQSGALEKKEMEMELFRIEQYVQMVLSYLRMKDMNSDLQIQKEDLDGMIRQAVRRYSRFFIGKHLHLEYEPIEKKVLTDEKWLVFVLEQLISNAVKYTPEGGTIRIYETEPGVVGIEDTGIGIRKEDQPRVFERGFTGFNGRAQKRATGLGLFLCREICEKLSHKISIVSEPGKGTLVLLDLRMMDLKF